LDFAQVLVDGRTLTAMRVALATALAALAAAAPAAAVTGGFGVSSALHASPFGLTKTGTGYNKTHSCQAGDRSAKTKRAGGKFAVVACEQPPRSNLVTPDAIAKATAAALSVFG